MTVIFLDFERPYRPSKGNIQHSLQNSAYMTGLCGRCCFCDKSGPRNMLSAKNESDLVKQK